MTGEDAIRLLLEREGGIGGRGDLARRWDVSSSRILQLVRQSGFPAPIAHVNGAAVYSLSAADAWRERQLRGASDAVRAPRRTSPRSAGNQRDAPNVGAERRSVAKDDLGW